MGYAGADSGGVRPAHEGAAKNRGHDQSGLAITPRRGGEHAGEGAHRKMPMKMTFQRQGPVIAAEQESALTAAAPVAVQSATSVTRKGLFGMMHNSGHIR